jgi:hypothetical protein
MEVIQLEQEPSDRDRRGNRYDAWVVLVMGAMVVLPAALTLLRVSEPRPGVDPSTDPTPYGYTWSLLLFIVPMAVIAFWFLRSATLSFQRKSFWTTIAILVPVGFVLDFLFGTTFFTFLNHGATLGIDFPAVGGSIPIEELVFYLTGFFVVLLLYIWADEYWVGAYNIPDYSSESEKVRRLLQFDGRSLAVGILLLACAFIYKRFFSEVPNGFPWYFTYLLAVAIIPSMGLYRSVASCINWRAFSNTFFFMLLVSLMWEATLGVPYEWWNYNHDVMMGVFVDAWTNLPLEAVLVWLAVTYTTVIVYEAVKIYYASGRSFKDALLGKP